ncbi:MAG: penicillin-binding protein activator LpoB [Spirochaetaceae bacterium]|nr:penicillin-binding protein activator LpoB [Spirochaetaceae bacterium]
MKTFFGFGRVRALAAALCAMLCGTALAGCKALPPGGSADNRVPASAAPAASGPTDGRVSAPAVLAASGSITLDEAIAQAAARMEARLPAGTEMALISVSSPSQTFSKYVLDRLESMLVNNGKLVVVDRANLDKVREEQGFQMSGEVSDESAKAIGKLIGANAIVTGSLISIGNSYQLTLKAINMESAIVAASHQADIANDERVRALLASGGGTVAPAVVAGGGRTPAAQGTSVPAGGDLASGGKATATKPAAAPLPAPQTQLFVGDALQGEMDLLDALDWIAMNAAGGGNYTIALGKDYAITPTELNYGGKAVTITLKSAAGSRALTFAGANPAYSLLIVQSGVTLTLEAGVTLRGTQNNADKSLVEVAGGRFIMNGGTITGNKKSGNGGGVKVTSGAFTMNGGAISGNTCGNGDSGGGVYVAGTFTMNGGTINGNTSGGSGGGVNVKGTFIMKEGNITGNNAYYYGGGVYADTFTMSGGTISENAAGNYGGGGVYAGAFTMSGGTINGNIAKNGSGGGVYAKEAFSMSGGTISGNTTDTSGGGVYTDRTFTKTGGVIYGSNADEANRARDDGYGHAVYVSNGKKRNTTARAATAMDSGKNGPAGGWE